MCLPKVMESWTVSSKIVHLLQCGWISLLSLEHSSIFSLEVIGQVTSKVANLFTVAKVSFHCCHSCLSIHCCQSCLSLLPQLSIDSLLPKFTFAVATVVYRFTVAKVAFHCCHSCLSIHCCQSLLSLLPQLSIDSLLPKLPFTVASCLSIHCCRAFHILTACAWQKLPIFALWAAQVVHLFTARERLAKVVHLLTALHATGKSCHCV